MVRRTGSSPHLKAPARVLLLMLVDAGVLFGAGAAAYLLWARPVHHQPAAIYLDLAPLLPLFLLGYAGAGLYPGFGLGPVELLRRLSVRTTFAFLALAAISFAFKLPYLFSRVTLFIAWILALVALPVCRVLVAQLGRRIEGWLEPIVVVGTGARTGELMRDIHSALLVGYQPVAIVSSDPSSLGPGTKGLPILDRPELVRELVADGVRTAVVVPEEHQPVGDLVEALQRHFQRVILMHGGAAFPVEGVEVRRLGRALGIEFHNRALKPGNRLLKRALDLTLGTVLFVLLSPFLAVAALAIKLTSGGPVLFRQQREGLGGRPVEVIKLRTMIEGAEDHLEARLAADGQLRENWARGFKLSKDPRVIPVIGSFLRRCSLDETPQLWQVLKGELSLVGPRPFPEYHLREFPDDFRALRRQVRPGLTGLWQVMARSLGDLEDQRVYDTYYIRNWSLWMDLDIVIRTVGAVLLGRGAL